MTCETPWARISSQATSSSVKLALAVQERVCPLLLVGDSLGMVVQGLETTVLLTVATSSCVASGERVSATTITRQSVR